MIDFSKIQHFAFQSTLSARRATDKSKIDRNADIDISIHALREESDSNIISTSINIRHDFNPRSPRGERLSPLPKVKGVTYQFQSTLSVRRATI